MDEGERLEECILEEEIPEVDMVEEDFGKEFLKQQEELAVEDNNLENDIAINENKSEEEPIEIEGREFLKNHQNHI